jgi:hypothetical protein
VSVRWPGSVHYVCMWTGIVLSCIHLSTQHKIESTILIAHEAHYAAANSGGIYKLYDTVALLTYIGSGRRSKLLEPDVKVRNISLGPIAKKIDSKAEFGEALWEDHIGATLKAIRELRFEIVDVSQQLQPVIRGGGDVIGQDGPTDVIWVMSLLLIIRTIGMLGSKSSDSRRPEDNRKAHSRLLESHLEDITTII